MTCSHDRFDRFYAAIPIVEKLSESWGDHRVPFRKDHVNRAWIRLEGARRLKSVPQDPAHWEEWQLPLAHLCQIRVGSEEEDAGHAITGDSREMSGRTRPNRFRHEVNRLVRGQRPQRLLCGGQKTLPTRRAGAGAIAGVFENENIDRGCGVNRVREIIAFHRAARIAMENENRRLDRSGARHAPAKMLASGTAPWVEPFLSRHRGRHISRHT